MDKYIKILLITLSTRYKVTVTNIMFYDEENGRIKNIFKLRMSDKANKKLICENTVYSKRDVVSELMKWQGG